MDSLNGVISFAFPGVPNVSCMFTGAVFGSIRVSAEIIPNKEEEEKKAKERRKILLQAIGAKNWVELNQVHGSTMLKDPEPTNPDEVSKLDADGSCTDKKQKALVIKTADCQPVLLVHKSGKYIAALHVGWRGNRSEFILSGVKEFCATYRISSQDIMAVRGPSLGPAAAEFVNFENEWAQRFNPWFNEQRRTMDLWTLTKDQLCLAGINPRNIFSLDLCTWSLPNDFYSHRRGHVARQASLICINAN